MFEFKVRHIETGEIYTVYNSAYLRDDENDKPVTLHFLVHMYGEWDYFPSCWFIPMDSELDISDNGESTDFEFEFGLRDIEPETNNTVEEA